MKLLTLVVIIVLVLSACGNHPITNSPTVSPTKKIDVLSPTMEPDLELARQTVTPVNTQNAPETLGTIKYLQYSYSIFHSYDFNSCTSTPYVCPDVYYAQLSDVYTWIYVQAGQTAWLKFNQDGNYQVKPSEENDAACSVAQNSENTNLVGVTCGEIGEYTLKFGLVNEKQRLTYPLILQFISVPEVSSPPVILPPGLIVEENELIQQPDTDPLFFKPTTGNSNTVLAKHETVRGQPVEGWQSVVLENGQQIQAEAVPQTIGLSNPKQVIAITVTQNGNQIFTKQAPVSPISAFRGLWAFENHWFVEIAVNQDDHSFRSFTKGDIFEDGKSLNKVYDYSESFGFQLLHGKPFYFFEKFGRVGISYDGQDIPLGYDYVPHNGCCSVGELNPKMYENMVGFFAVRGDKWYYVEIGAFE